VIWCYFFLDFGAAFLGLFVTFFTAGFFAIAMMSSSVIDDPAYPTLPIEAFTSKLHPHQAWMPSFSPYYDPGICAYLSLQPATRRIIGGPVFRSFQSAGLSRLS
jgi:hypothetical protein